MKSSAFANAVLWAAAIVAAAIVGAPAVLALVALPLLAMASWLVMHQGPRHGAV